MPYVWAGIGLVLLYFGARFFIRGSSRLGQMLGISPIVIGLTVVAYGTSTPEMVVSAMGAWSGDPGIALGNVVGSNIVNVLFILGVSASIVPLIVNQRLIQYDVPLVLGTSLFVCLLSWNRWLGRGEALLLILAIVLYTVWVVHESRTEPPGIQEEYQREFAGGSEPIGPANLATASGLALLGLAVLILGSRVFTNAATSLARSFGVSNVVIGLTIVAAGTSLPEVGTSVLAALRGEPDIAVGNVIGSNFFNLTGVLGSAGIASGTGIPIPHDIFLFDFPVLILVSVICLPIFFTGHRISRWEGFLFVVYYALYTASLLTPQLHPLVARSLFYLLVVFVIPLTTLTLGVGIIRQTKSRV